MENEQFHSQPDRQQEIQLPIYAAESHKFHRLKSQFQVGFEAIKNEITEFFTRASEKFARWLNFVFVAVAILSSVYAPEVLPDGLIKTS